MYRRARAQHHICKTETRANNDEAGPTDQQGWNSALLNERGGGIRHPHYAAQISANHINELYNCIYTQSLPLPISSLYLHLRRPLHPEHCAKPQFAKNTKELARPCTRPRLTLQQTQMMESNIRRIPPHRRQTPRTPHPPPPHPTSTPSPSPSKPSPIPRPHPR